MIVILRDWGIMDLKIRYKKVGFCFYFKNEFATVKHNIFFKQFDI